MEEKKEMKERVFKMPRAIFISLSLSPKPEEMAKPFPCQAKGTPQQETYFSSLKKNKKREKKVTEKLYLCNQMRKTIL